jgi:hypothetical protein
MLRLLGGVMIFNLGVIVGMTVIAFCQAAKNGDKRGV